MIAVLFEVRLKSGHEQQYLDIAARLRPHLDQIDGFISVERFQSLTDEGKYLSLSFFQDEDALAEWRSRHAHRDAQKMGKEAVFDDYRVRVAGVMRDYGMKDRDQAPLESPKHAQHQN